MPTRNRVGFPAKARIIIRQSKTLVPRQLVVAPQAKPLHDKATGSSAVVGREKPINRYRPPARRRLDEPLFSANQVGCFIHGPPPKHRGGWGRIPGTRCFALPINRKTSFPVIERFHG